MKRNTLNFVIDVISLLVMWGLVTTGLLMKCLMPPGTGHWLALGGMNRHGWGNIHFWLGAAACILMFLHVFLHWQWVVATVQRFLAPSSSDGAPSSRARRALWGGVLVAGLLTGTVGLLAGANSMVVQLEPSEAELEDHHHHHIGSPADQGDMPSADRSHAQKQKPAVEAASQQPHHRIRCLTSLGEAAAIKKLPIGEFRRRLGIPDSIAATETVGDAGAKHGFTVHDVRALPEGGRPTTTSSGG